MHDENCFITLTYNDENLPWDGSLNKEHFQRFMKRLRFHFRPKPIRYFHCGEYGDQLHRPHYHALLFGHDFDDKDLHAQSDDGHRLWVSETLAKLWPFGFSTIGTVSWETAAYCARYTQKKITGAAANEHYWRPLATDMEVLLQPEYATMSLKPAIGKTWFDTYAGDCFPTDFVTHRGRKRRVPRYYDTLLGRDDETALNRVKEKRIQKAHAWMHENTPTRLRAREACQQAKLDTLKRNLGG